MYIDLYMCVYVYNYIDTLISELSSLHGKNGFTEIQVWK